MSKMDFLIPKKPSNSKKKLETDFAGHPVRTILECTWRNIIEIEVMHFFSAHTLTPDMQKVRNLGT